MYVPDRFYVICPHCGQQNILMADDVNYGGWATVGCDAEEGGCDETFAVHIRAEYHKTTYVLTEKSHPYVGAEGGA
jgi:phage terminase large subunit GpA-like protein